MQAISNFRTIIATLANGQNVTIFAGSLIACMRDRLREFVGGKEPVVGVSKCRRSYRSQYRLGWLCGHHGAPALVTMAARPAMAAPRIADRG